MNDTEPVSDVLTDEQVLIASDWADDSQDAFEHDAAAAWLALALTSHEALRTALATAQEDNERLRADKYRLKRDVQTLEAENDRLIAAEERGQRLWHDEQGRAERAEAALERVTAALRETSASYHYSSHDAKVGTWATCDRASCTRPRAVLASLPPKEGGA